MKDNQPPVTQDTMKAILRSYDRDTLFYDQIVNVGADYDWGLSPYDNFELGNYPYSVGSNQTIIDIDGVIHNMVRVYHDNKGVYTAVYTYPATVNSACVFHWITWDGNNSARGSAHVALDILLDRYDCLSGLGARIRFFALPQRIQDAVIAELENDWWHWLPEKFKRNTF